MCARSRRVRVENESSTSSAVRSRMTPRARCLDTLTTSVSRNFSKSPSVSADWTVAMRYAPCLRIGTSMYAPCFGSSIQILAGLAARLRAH